MSYLSECLADSPTVLYPMSSYSSGYADSSGNTRHLDVLSGTAPASTATGPDGVANDAAAWGASAGFLRTTYTQNGPSIGTYEFWFRYAAAPAASLALTVWCPNSGSNGAVTYVAMYGTGANAGKLSFSVTDGSGTQAIDSPTALSTNIWHHVVCSWGAGGMTMRIDKSTAVTGAKTSALSQASNSFRVHGYWSGSANIIQTGAVDMAWAGFYPTKLSDARTDAHYDAMHPSGALAGTLPLPTPAFTGSYVPPAISGTMGATLPLPTPAFAGTYSRPEGTLAATLAVPTVDFTGTYTPPPNPTGILAASLPVPAVDFTGGYTPPTESGTLDIAALVPVVAFTGTYTPAAITGTLDAVLPLPTLAFTGDSADISGAFAAVLPLPVVSLVGTYGGPYPTDTSNLLDGLDMACLGTVTMTRPAVTPPSGVGVKVDKAIPYPAPTMVGGRPT